MSERKEKFTPGPWRVRRIAEFDIYKNASLFVLANDNGIINTGKDATTVATMPNLHNYPDDKTIYANAALIAAAPEMYAELKDLLDAMEAGLFPQAVPGVDYPAVMEKKWELRKLLKKARGEE